MKTIAWAAIAGIGYLLIKGKASEVIVAPDVAATNEEVQHGVMTTPIPSFLAGSVGTKWVPAGNIPVAAAANIPVVDLPNIPAYLLSFKPVVQDIPAYNLFQDTPLTIASKQAKAATALAKYQEQLKVNAADTLRFNKLVADWTAGYNTEQAALKSANYTNIT